MMVCVSIKLVVLTVLAVELAMTLTVQMVVMLGLVRVPVACVVSILLDEVVFVFTQVVELMTVVVPVRVMLEVIAVEVVTV